MGKFLLNLSGATKPVAIETTHDDAKLDIALQAEIEDAATQHAQSLVDAAEEATELAQKETATYRDAMIAVILAAGAVTEKEFDADGEKAFLETLDAKRLMLHFDRARKVDLTQEPKTTDPNTEERNGDEKPEEGSVDAAYAQFAPKLNTEV